MMGEYKSYMQRMFEAERKIKELEAQLQTVLDENELLKGHNSTTGAER